MAKPKARTKSGEVGRKNKSQKSKTRTAAKAAPKKAVAKKGGGKRVPQKRSIPVRVKQYFRDVRQELRKTVWPTRQQVITSSIVVVVVLVVFSAYIAVLDFAWLQLIEAITAQF